MQLPFDARAIGRKLNYIFNDEQLLKRSLTHRSCGTANNERLEFLGDAILNFVIAQNLFTKFPTAKEGELSRLRASLVKGETLSKIALELTLGEYLILGEGELKSGGFRRASILADAFEAVIGAIYLDSDIQTASAWVSAKFTQRLEGIALEDDARDAKSQLQEWLQARRLPLPIYEVASAEGDAHNQVFTVICRVAAINKTTQAIASNRKNAEKEAASLMMKELSVGKTHVG